jgi:curved DNA-binding protein CbpA
MTTLYDTLDVSEHATTDEIKRAYRKAAMRWHPDRNVGREQLARTAFLEIQNAYAILSDPVQRQVYDTVFAEEMQRREEQRQQEERELAEREAAIRAAEEAAYANMVALAMRFATQGYNRDVVLGVLLGRDCGIELAQRIADSALALHTSRQAEVLAKARAEAEAEAEAKAKAEAEARTDAMQASEAHTPEAASARQEEEPAATDRARSFSDIWFPFWNMLRS